MFWVIVSWLLAAAFLAGGIVNMLGRPSVRADFRRWGYPENFHFVPGILQLAAAALIVIPGYRLYGLLLGAAVCIAAALTLLRWKEYSHLAPSIVLTAIITAVVSFG